MCTQNHQSYLTLAVLLQRQHLYFYPDHWDRSVKYGYTYSKRVLHNVPEHNYQLRRSASYAVNMDILRRNQQSYLRGSIWRPARRDSRASWYRSSCIQRVLFRIYKCLLQRNMNYNVNDHISNTSCRQMIIREDLGDVTKFTNYISFCSLKGGMCITKG
jgi:hypothetical protein